MTEIAALTYTVLGIILIIFHLALAVGAPWGRLTMGGFYEGVLPKKLRVAAVAQALLIVVTIIIVLAKANLWFNSLQSLASIGIWLVVALFAISSVLNLITSSAWERHTGGPASVCMLICSLIIALS